MTPVVYQDEAIQVFRSPDGALIAECICQTVENSLFLLFSGEVVEAQSFVPSMPPEGIWLMPQVAILKKGGVVKLTANFTPNNCVLLDAMQYFENVDVYPLMENVSAGKVRIWHRLIPGCNPVELQESA